MAARRLLRLALIFASLLVAFVSTRSASATETATAKGGKPVWAPPERPPTETCEGVAPPRRCPPPVAPELNTGVMGDLGISLIIPGAALTLMGGGIALTIAKEPPHEDDDDALLAALAIGGGGLLITGVGALLLVFDDPEGSTSVAVGPGSVDVRGSF